MSSTADLPAVIDFLLAVAEQHRERLLFLIEEKHVRPALLCINPGRLDARWLFRPVSGEEMPPLTSDQLAVVSTSQRLLTMLFCPKLGAPADDGPDASGVLWPMAPMSGEAFLIVLAGQRGFYFLPARLEATAIRSLGAGQFVAHVATYEPA